jgi:hypothetical protein
MRIRFFLAVASMSVVAVGVGVQACGGSSTDTATADAATEASTEAGKPDAEVDARPPCDPTKDIVANIPDAAIGDGGATTGKCIACVKTSCAAEVKTCQGDCSLSDTELGCQDLAGKAIECYTKTQNFLSCAGGFITARKSTQALGLALGNCVSNSCKTECGVPDLTDAGDAGDGG